MGRWEFQPTLSTTFRSRQAEHRSGAWSILALTANARTEKDASPPVNIMTGLPESRFEKVLEDILDVLTGRGLHQEVRYSPVAGWENDGSVQAIAVESPLGKKERCSLLPFSEALRSGDSVGEDRCRPNLDLRCQRSCLMPPELVGGRRARRTTHRSWRVVWFRATARASGRINSREGRRAAPGR